MAQWFGVGGELSQCLWMVELAWGGGSSVARGGGISSVVGRGSSVVVGGEWVGI